MTRYRIKDWKFVVLWHVVFVVSFGAHCIFEDRPTQIWMWVMLGAVYVLTMLSTLEKKAS